MPLLFVGTAAYGQTNQRRQSAPLVIGVVDSIHSSILSETRVVNISFPENYATDTTANYPVIYLLDGGVDEDFIHIAGLVKYYTTSWINRFAPSIVVGIENINRKKDFTFATPDLRFVSQLGFDTAAFASRGGSQKFIAFIEKELQPYISKHYRATKSKTIIGESLGGLLATEILLRKPTLFDTYIIISPSLWWGSEALLKTGNVLSTTNFTDSIKVYIGAANKEEDNMMYKDAQQLALQLKKYGNPAMSVNFDYLPGETHATIIHPAVYNAFKILYPVKNRKQ